jgi:hypothetical protein
MQPVRHKEMSRIIDSSIQPASYSHSQLQQYQDQHLSSMVSTDVENKMDLKN